MDIPHDIEETPAEEEFLELISERQCLARRRSDLDPTLLLILLCILHQEV